MSISPDSSGNGGYEREHHHQPWTDDGPESGHYPHQLQTLFHDGDSGAPKPSTLKTNPPIPHLEDRDVDTVTQQIAQKVDGGPTVDAGTSTYCEQPSVYGFYITGFCFLFYRVLYYGVHMIEFRVLGFLALGLAFRNQDFRRLPQQHVAQPPQPLLLSRTRPTLKGAAAW